MSVINQMLRDLDARQASQQERAGLPQRVRTLPPRKVAKSRAWLLLVGGMLAGAMIAWLAVSQWSPAGKAAGPEPVAAAAVPVPLPPVPAAPVVPVAEVSAASATLPAQAELRETAHSSKELGEMKIETQMAAPKTQEPIQSVAPTARTEDRPVAESRRVSPPVARPATASPSNASPSSGQIDKRSKGTPARDLAEAEYRKGMQSARNGDNTAAVQSMQRALELDHDYAQARQALLSILVSSKQWGEAQQVAQRGLALDPAQSGWALVLARLQFEQGDIAAAVDTLGRHAAHAGADADYQGLFAYLLQKQQRPAEAAERYQLALGLRPREGRWWYGLGLALEGAGRRGEAREAFAKAREAGGLPSEMMAAIEQKLR